MNADLEARIAANARRLERASTVSADQAAAKAIRDAASIELTSQRCNRCGNRVVPLVCVPGPYLCVECKAEVSRWDEVVWWCDREPYSRIHADPPRGPARR